MFTVEDRKQALLRRVDSRANMGSSVTDGITGMVAGVFIFGVVVAGLVLGAGR